MITVRAADSRGRAQFGWLDSRHTFSFGEYYDAKFLGFGPLRVINEDRVQPGRGFDTHAHRDMEIVSYVIDGALEHKDSLGTGSVIRPGDVQRMSAGTGVRHSEYNASNAEPVHFLQIWIHPSAQGLPPSYEQKHFSEAERSGVWRLVASADGRDGSVLVHQDVSIHAALLGAGQTLRTGLAAGRLGWVQVVRGTLELNGQRLAAGDGAAIENESELAVTASAPAELLFFDLPAAF